MTTAPATKAKPSGKRLFYICVLACVAAFASLLWMYISLFFLDTLPTVFVFYTGALSTSISIGTAIALLIKRYPKKKLIIIVLVLDVLLVLAVVAYVVLLIYGVVLGIEAVMKGLNFKYI